MSLPLNSRDHDNPTATTIIDNDTDHQTWQQLQTSRSHATRRTDVH